jgi:hypothetical protein
VPGVVLVRADGTIAWRRISHDKADRPSVREVLAQIDRAFGPPAHAPALRGGFKAISRAQVGLALGGSVFGAERHGDAVARLDLLYPLGRHILAGADAGLTLRTRASADAVLALRIPFYDDLAAVNLAAVGGYDGDWRAGGRATLYFSWTPTWGLAVSATATGPTLDATLTANVIWQLRVR